jgi:glycosyltransferase involved in cell wall biosynthesis
MNMEKGIPELVQAIAHLPSSNGKGPLLLCVGGPMDVVPGYLEIARQHDVPQLNLRFVDRVPNREVPFWILACDLVTIPWGWTEFSAYYTSPMKLFEYLAAGTPIIASDLPSIREVLRHGENAWLVEPGDAHALARGIAHLLRNDALKTKISAGAQRSVAKYAWRARAASILNQV